MHSALLSLAVITGLISAGTDSRSVVKGHTRFQVLEGGLLRMEYSPQSRFVDEPSVAVVGRDSFQGATCQTQEKDGWFNLSTAGLTVSYKLDSGPLGKDNLRITWHDKSGDHLWKPGDPDPQNLGGIPGQLGMRSTVRVTNPGPLTRAGYYWLDDSHTALFDAPAQWVKPRAEQNGQDWYFLVYGNDFAAALGTLAKLTGPVPMLPRYVFGVWFGSRACYSDQQWKLIAEQFREGHFPMDIFVLDSYSTRKVVWSGFDWDYEQMPDPKGFLAWMKQRGVKVTINEHYGPLTPQNDENFDAIRKAMGLPEGTGAIGHNLADKKYAELYMTLLHKPPLDMGMAFWWQDGAAGSSMPGLDPYLWTRHVEYTGSEKITGQRTTTFCRLGESPWGGAAVGSHRYGINFTGDLHGVWQSLPVLVPATIRGGNQLMPYMNNLCCGVFVDNLPRELYQRWVQFSSLSPLFWFHGVWGLRLPWEYGPEGEATYRQFVGLRYALLPYIYSYSRTAHETGLPLVRGMYLDYPDQESAYASDQQYMFGRELLVAPVTKPGNGKAVNTDVYLPAGDDWIDFFTGDIYEGARKIVHQCPLERMPVFVRAGSILPMGPKLDFSDQGPVDPLTLDVYAGRHAASFSLYEDDGTSLDYRKGAFTRTTINFAPAQNPQDYLLTVGPAQGQFSGQLKQRRYQVRLHGLLKPDGVVVNRQTLPEIAAGEGGAGWTWDAQSRTTTLRLPGTFSTGEPLSVEVHGAGTFADALTLQKALSLRDQVRQAKRLMKLKHSALCGMTGEGPTKPPRVIRTTEEVETALGAVIAHPRGVASNPPDFQAIRQRVLGALTDQPFESRRKIPEADPNCAATIKAIDKVGFTPAEREEISKTLRGAEVPAWILVVP